MEFEIEDIPVKGDGYESKYKFGSMRVGQSFIVPPEMKSKIASASAWYGKRHNKKFSIRITGGVIRCGRIA